MDKDLQKCYEILKLDSGASLQEVKTAYKELSFIWHPERIPKHKNKLIEKANKELKKINYA